MWLGWPHQVLGLRLCCNMPHQPQGAHPAALVELRQQITPGAVSMMSSSRGAPKADAVYAMRCAIANISLYLVNSTVACVKADPRALSCWSSEPSCAVAQSRTQGRVQLNTQGREIVITRSRRNTASSLPQSSGYTRHAPTHISRGGPC